MPRPSLDILGAPRILFAAAPLIVPMTLQLSSLSLRAIVVLVVSRQKGITLVFKNDPLESVNVSSSFDGVDSVAGYIQKEIEGQLREAFRSDLPGVIHRLSQKWLSGEVRSSQGEGAFEKDAKIETRTSYKGGAGGERGRGLVRGMSSMSLGDQSIGSERDRETSYSSVGDMSRTQSLDRATKAERRKTMPPPSTRTRDDPLASVPESGEAYDPTYGLRKQSISSEARFADYERLVRLESSGRGLGDILSNSDEDDLGPYHPMDGSFELIGLRDLVEDGPGVGLPRWDSAPSLSNEYRRPSGYNLGIGTSQSVMGYETSPAVGGGTITRPRVFHSQSQVRTRTASSGSLSAHGSASVGTARGLGDFSTAATSIAMGRMTPGFGVAPLEGRHEYFASLSATGRSGSSTPRFPFQQRGRDGPPYSSTPSLARNSSLPANFQRNRSHIPPSQSSSSTSPHRASSLFPSRLSSSGSSPPSSLPSPMKSPEGTPPPPRRNSAIDALSRSPESIANDSFDADLPITLSPAHNDSCAHLATLTSSHQTLSPFTRNTEHFMVRSSPHVVTRQGPTDLRRNGVPIHLRMSSDALNLPLKAKRKRIHRIGSAKPLPPPVVSASGYASPRRGIVEGGGPFSPNGSTGMRSYAPSEMSDYFPSLPQRGREVWDDDP